MTSQHSYVMTSKKYCGKFEVKWFKIKELARAPKTFLLQNTFFVHTTTIAQTMTSSKIFRHFDLFFRILIKDILKKYRGKLYSEQKAQSG